MKNLLLKKSLLFILALSLTEGYAQNKSLSSNDNSRTLKIENRTNKAPAKFANAKDEATIKADANKVFELPFSDAFDNGEDVLNNYTFIDANGDAKENTNKWFWKEDETLIQYNSESGVTADDWVITPGIHFDGKNKYCLNFSINMGSESTLKVTLGKSKDPADHEIILELNNIWDSWVTDHEVSFDVPSDGTYYIGFQNLSSDCFYFNLHTISIKEKQTFVPGTVFELPYFDDFKDGDWTNAAYTFIDVDNDAHDNLNKWYWKADEKLVQYCSDKEHKGNDWFITPPIHFDGKNLYDFKFSMNNGAPSNVKVMLGTSTDPSSFTTEILDLKDVQSSFQTDFNGNFRVPEDGNYYIGFYNYSDAESFYLNIFNINIEKGLSGDHPDKVSDFTVTPGDNGEKKAIITFNAPKTNVCGQALEGTFKINLYRGETLCKTFDATAGEKFTFEDTVEKAGNFTYKLIVVNNDIESIPEEKTVWIGPDYSEAVKNIMATTTSDNMDVIVTWEAPTKGKNNGYFNIDDVNYNVYRSYDGKEFTMIDCNIKELTYTDTSIKNELNGLQEAYFYAVTAVTDAGESDAASKLVSVGTPYKLPQYESFENGMFNIEPWTTDPIEGSFAWQCKRSDKDGGGYPIDHDKGFNKFYNPWSDKADSRLKSPIFDLSGSKNPMFSFNMLHWEAESIKDDNNQTKCIIEISVDGGEFEAIAPEFTAANKEYGWFEHRISLDKYKDAKKVQFGVRGYTDNKWMYYYIDDIRIEEQCENDLAIAEFFSTSQAVMNDSIQIDVRYLNRGTKDASNYTIDIYQDEELVTSIKGEDIKVGEYKSISFKHQMTAAKANEVSDIYAVINYSADENTENNTSWYLSTKTKGTWYPTVNNLKGEISKTQGVDLKWEAPFIPEEPTATTDDIENYVSFLIDDIGNWTTVDGDRRGSGCVKDFPEFEHKGKDMAFMVWEPNQITDFSAEKYPALVPHSGNKCLISWYANTSFDGGDVFNDDYLISPEVLGGTKVKFYIKRAGEDKDENYQIMYSSTLPNKDSLNVIESRVAGSEWELVEVTLPQDARYFAIHYNAVLQTGIMVDDIEYTSAISELKIQGYNVFRNGQKINNEIVKDNQFCDKLVEEGKAYEYQVSAIFDRGESNACQSILVSIPSGINETESLTQIDTHNNGITVTTSEELNVNIYTTEGSMIYSEKINGTKDICLAKGLYIVKISDKSIKVLVR